MALFGRKKVDTRRLDKEASKLVITTSVLDLATKLITEPKDEDEETITEGQVGVLRSDISGLPDYMAIQGIPGYMQVTTKRVLWANVAEPKVRSMPLDWSTRVESTYDFQGTPWTYIEWNDPEPYEAYLTMEMAMIEEEIPEDEDELERLRSKVNSIRQGFVLPPGSDFVQAINSNKKPAPPE